MLEPEPEEKSPPIENNEETLPEFLERKFQEDKKLKQKPMKNRNNEQSNPYKYICIFLLAIVIVGAFAFLGYERYYRGRVDQQLEDLRKQQEQLKAEPAKTSIINEVKNSVTTKVAKAEALPTTTGGKTAVVYAYNSEVTQTDGDPFTTASGSKVRDGIVANNCLKFGTKVEIGGRVYEVQDRMNSRYDCNTYDIWFESKAEALKWGKKTIQVKVL